MFNKNWQVSTFRQPNVSYISSLSYKTPNGLFQLGVLGNEKSLSVKALVKQFQENFDDKANMLTEEQKEYIKLRIKHDDLELIMLDVMKKNDKEKANILKEVIADLKVQLKEWES